MVRAVRAHGHPSHLERAGGARRGRVFEDAPPPDVHLLPEPERALLRHLDSQRVCVNDFRAKGPDHHCAACASATAHDLEVSRKSSVHSGTSPLRHQDRDPSRVYDLAATARQQGAT